MLCSKSYEKALLLKERGNVWYRKKQTTDALRCYTEVGLMQLGKLDLSPFTSVCKCVMPFYLL